MRNAKCGIIQKINEFMRSTSNTPLLKRNSSRGLIQYFLSRKIQMKNEDLSDDAVQRYCEYDRSSYSLK